MLKPLSNFIVLRTLEGKEQVTDAGLVIPGKKTGPFRGVVLAVGEGMRNPRGELIPMSVKVGDTVLYGNCVGCEVEGESVVFTRETDVLAVL